MLFGTGPLFFLNAGSRKTHGAAGTFDINLPGIECRNSGGNHTIVFKFTNNVVSGSAMVTGGTATLVGSPTFTDNEMALNLTGVTNIQTVSVSVSNVTDNFGEVLAGAATSMGVLIGDTNGNGVVNAGDTTQTQGRSGQTTDATNFRSDVNTDGTINSGDHHRREAALGNRPAVTV